MYKNKLNFWDFVAANRGEKFARWKIIKSYEKYINKVTRGNMDMKNSIILGLYDIFDGLNEKYERNYVRKNK